MWGSVTQMCVFSQPFLGVAQWCEVGVSTTTRTGRKHTRIVQKSSVQSDLNSPLGRGPRLLHFQPKFAANCLDNVGGSVILETSDRDSDRDSEEKRREQKKEQLTTNIAVTLV